MQSTTSSTGQSKIVLGAGASSRNVKVELHHQRQGGCALHQPLICRNDENLLKATLDVAIRSFTTRMVKELNIPALSLLIPLQIAS